MAHQLPTTIPFVNRTPAHGLETRTARGGRARRKVGVKDVAREAGVSLGTVSNVLNHPEVVAEATRKRVLDVIGSIGYVRAQGAQQVDGLASRVIAVLGLNGADPYFTALATGVEQAAGEAGLGVMVCTGAREGAEDGRHLALIAAHRIRGAVLVSGEEQSEPRLRCVGMRCLSSWPTSTCSNRLRAPWESMMSPGVTRLSVTCSSKGTGPLCTSAVPTSSRRYGTGAQEHVVPSAGPDSPRTPCMSSRAQP